MIFLLKTLAWLNVDAFHLLVARHYYILAFLRMRKIASDDGGESLSKREVSRWILWPAGDSDGSGRVDDEMMMMVFACRFYTFYFGHTKFRCLCLCHSEHKRLVRKLYVPGSVCVCACKCVCL